MFIFSAIFELMPNFLKRSQEDGLLFDFRTVRDFSKWTEISDTVRAAGRSKAIITSHHGAVSVYLATDGTVQKFGCAIFFYLLDPLPNGACFAGVRYNGTRWNLSDYDGIEAELRCTGSNEWFKIAFDQKYSYEKQFQMKAFHRGKPVDNAPPLNTSNLDFGIQVFGGIYEKFKQSGPGSLQINWVRAYKTPK
ncbi:unnamed protein product [Dibothriocephalus latus]|uniref:NADH:ubiquinone oxidoreductase intermediate-associated protein 30 domain-containing protein n=1 Tax=Dibothriocephalus latus TaxID=60516 RepID=A0A3P7L0H2_DIBLA|nr:unnamed protein product [Dibothriocephalus latus]